MPKKKEEFKENSRGKKNDKTQNFKTKTAPFEAQNKNLKHKN